METTADVISTHRVARFQIVALITVAALGYFVDAYDLIVASVVRSSAIVSLGLAEAGTDTHKSWAYFFENAQSAGILLGGIAFGILGDKFGRKKVLYSSILVYSLANIFNGLLVASIPSVGSIYAVLRFIGGFALAAELSVGIVMIAETMRSKTRGYGSMIVVSFGVMGCVLAAVLFEFWHLSWQSLFLIGGVAGLALLALRAGVAETSYFLTDENLAAERGNLMMVFRSKRLTKTFIACILLGLPIYFFVSIPIKFAADYGKELGLTIAGTVPIIVFYIALSLSDIVANYLSQILRSRKRVLYMYILMSLIPILALYLIPPKTAAQYFFVFAPMMGIASGYWALLITFTAEQVGTNIRSTLATSVPNIIRSMFIPISILLTFLQPKYGTSATVLVIGLGTVALALLGNSLLRETWGTDLAFVERVSP